MVRVDHFRGFEAYWEVPAGEKTAVNGRWVKGPGAAFFQAVEARLGKLPIIAENLGVITSEVEAIRRQFGYPGMSGLQFAFGTDPQGPSFRPHNYPRELVAYTGSHDNDTTLGSWNSGGDGLHSQRGGNRGGARHRQTLPAPFWRKMPRRSVRFSPIFRTRWLCWRATAMSAARRSTTSVSATSERRRRARTSACILRPEGLLRTERPLIARADTTACGDACHSARIPASICWSSRALISRRCCPPQSRILPAAAGWSRTIPRGLEPPAQRARPRRHTVARVPGPSRVGDAG